MLMTYSKAQSKKKIKVSSPYFSASISFVASQVVLRSNVGPFIAAYEVSADIVQPKIIKHFENATVTNTSTNNSTIS
jgi:hypothetical protein